MSVEKAHEFLKELKANGPSPDLMKRIGTDFQSEHMHEALKSKDTSKDELLKAASGGSAEGWEIGLGAPVAGAAAAGA